MGICPSQVSWPCFGTSRFGQVGGAPLSFLLKQNHPYGDGDDDVECARDHGGISNRHKFLFENSYAFPTLMVEVFLFVLEGSQTLGHPPLSVTRDISSLCDDNKNDDVKCIHDHGELSYMDIMELKLC